jgi:hypothetical protein
MASMSKESGANPLLTIGMNSMGRSDEDHVWDVLKWTISSEEKNEPKIIQNMN